MTIYVYIDGSCRPVNPGGIGVYSFIIYLGNEEIYKESDVIGEGSHISSVLAEYTALLRAIEWLYTHNLVNEKIVVRSDSQLLVNQMNDVWKAKSGLYYDTYKHVKDLCKGLDITFEWIPRESNKLTDKMCKVTYNRYICCR